MGDVRVFFHRHGGDDITATLGKVDAVQCIDREVLAIPFTRHATARIQLHPFKIIAQDEINHAGHRIRTVDR